MTDAIQGQFFTPKLEKLLKGAKSGISVPSEPFALLRGRDKDGGVLIISPDQDMSKMDQAEAEKYYGALKQKHGLSSIGPADPSKSRFLFPKDKSKPGRPEAPPLPEPADKGFRFLINI